MMDCKNCQDMKRVHEDGCNYIKCMATKSRKGRTIDWHMDTARYIDGKFVKTPIEEINEYFEKRMNNHKTPKWCPKMKEDIS